MIRMGWQEVLGFVLLLGGLFQQACASDQRLIADRRWGLDGSCSGSSFSSPSAKFSAADVGKVLVISGDSRSTKAAGPGNWDNAPLFATITAYLSPSKVMIDEVCNSAMSGVRTAHWDLGTDNTIALQKCLEAPICNVNAGSYLISGPKEGQVTLTHLQRYPYDSNVRPPSNSKLICAPGAEFIFPHHDTYNDINRTFLTIEDAHDVVISGCTISGTNLHERFTAGTEGNYAIVIVGDKSANNLIVNNTIRGGWSDGDIMINNRFDRSPVGVPTNNVIADNSITGCGYNGIAIVSGTSNVIKGNTLIDCNLDIEPNSGSPPNGPVYFNVVAGNTIINSHRQGQFVSTCAVQACSEFGGETIAVVNNVFAGTLKLYPYCRNEASGQIWTNNRTSTLDAKMALSGARCRLGSAGCPSVTSDSCVPPLNEIRN